MQHPRSITNSFMLGGSGMAGLYHEVSEEEAEAVVMTAWQRYGIRNIDTAPHYGCGLSEERIGTALKRLVLEEEGEEGPSLRIYTKVGRVMLPLHHSEVDASKFTIEYSNIPYSASCAFKLPAGKEGIFGKRTPVFDYSYEGVKTSFADSVKRLQTSQIYGLRLHDFDTSTKNTDMAGTEGLRSLLDLKRRGVIQDVGLGVNSPRAAKDLIDMSATFETPPPEGEGEIKDQGSDQSFLSRKPVIDSIMLANSWNLLEHSADAEHLLKHCRSKGIKVHLGGVFASGVLVGGNTYKYQVLESDSPVYLKVKQWERLCEQFSVELPVAAIGFSLLYQEVDKICIGIKSVVELDQVVDWFNKSLLLSKEFWIKAKDIGLLAPYIEIP